MDEFELEHEDLGRELRERIDHFEIMKATIQAKAAEHVARCDRAIFDAKAALKGLLSARPAFDGPDSDEGEPGKLTIKEMAMEVISSLEQGGKTQTILALMNDRFGANITRESLSPQLSRLREAGKLALRGRTWFPASSASAMAGGIPFPDQAPNGNGAAHESATDEPW